METNLTLNSASNMLIFEILCLAFTTFSNLSAVELREHVPRIVDRLL